MNDYQIEKREFPEGYDLQWVACKVCDEEVNIGEYLRGGWEPVLRSDFHGKFADRGNDHEALAQIVNGGQILLKRSKTASDEAKEREREAARAQMRPALARIGKWDHDPQEFIRIAIEAGAIRSEIEPLPPVVPLPRGVSLWARFRHYVWREWHGWHVWVQVKLLTELQREHARIAMISEREYAENVIKLRKQRR